MPSRPSKSLPPKDRHFLANTLVSHYRQGDWQYTGTCWREAFWDGKEYRLWCGAEQYRTTEPLNFKEWSELP
jgi:hypothetical protein